MSRIAIFLFAALVLMTPAVAQNVYTAEPTAQ